MTKKKLGYSVFKYKDLTRPHHSFDKKGKEVITNKTISGCLIVVKENGDSIVGTADELRALGIVVPNNVIAEFKQKPTNDGIIPTPTDEVVDTSDKGDQNNGQLTLNLTNTDTTVTNK